MKPSKDENNLIGNFKNKIMNNLKDIIENQKKYDLNYLVFSKFKIDNHWLLNEVNKEIFNFYDDKLNNEIHKIKLSKNIRNELYLYRWVEINGYEGFVDNYEKIQDFLFNVKSFFYKRLNYYRHLINNHKISPQLVFYDFLGSWESLLIKKIVDYRFNEIEAKRKQFLKDLYNKIEVLKSSKKILQTAFNFFGRFWEYDESMVSKINTTILEKFSYYLEEDPSIIQIAALLGRYAGISNLIEERIYERIVMINTWQPIGKWPEEIVGATESKDLEHLYPQELVNLFHPVLKYLFFKKYIEGKLLTFEFLSDDLAPTETIQEDIVQLPIPLEKGPFIICVDTSSSMQGLPETIAKAICLAVAKIGIRDKRPCYIINFSNYFKYYDLSNAGASLPKLLEFLTTRFNGNTNVEPAIHHAMQIMDTDEYFNADVLVLSDFNVPDLSPETYKIMRQLKERRNRFHSIIIGNTKKEKIWPEFNNAWYYDPSDPLTAEKITISLENEFIAAYEKFDIKEVMEK